jgi:hypothetical protein
MVHVFKNVSVAQTRNRKSLHITAEASYADSSFYSLSELSNWCNVYTVPVHDLNPGYSYVSKRHNNIKLPLLTALKHYIVRYFKLGKVCRDA